eukprot:CAMPEP_0197844634 /NCGR_PEP_ID=MMETSP1438-20131217/1631_1 /TAXON_ID=1461541 /ORGANISM="Pterosperma sp., Strain CCMP1384" /LENGTH=312 /DNA_ID=CAMNT_0043455549 /DNA_START=385 /DNA_END=1323 /DNA_ORIENTATION=-
MTTGECTQRRLFYCRGSSAKFTTVSKDTSEAEKLTLPESQKPRGSDVQQRLRIVGTSFENRQQTLQQLRTHQPLVLERERHNPFDPQAVIAKRLDGTDIGYIPKDRTDLFSYETTFGRVCSVGPVKEGDAAGALGMTVVCVPSKPSTTIDMIPRQLSFSGTDLKGQCNLSKMLPAADWDMLRKDAYKHAEYRCEVCSATGPKWPVEAHEQWTLDFSKNEMALTGIQALCPLCHQVRHLLTQRPRHSSVVRHLSKVNSWTAEETRVYINHAAKVQDEMSKSEWTVNLDWLDKAYPGTQDRVQPASDSAFSATD